MKIKNKKPILAVSFILILGISLIIFWFLILNYLMSVKNKNILLAEELKSVSRKIEKARNLEELYESLKSERDITEKIILNKENFINFIKTLEFSASSTNTELSISSALMDEYPVLSLEVKGDFDKIFKFIKLTENFSYITFFNRITLQKDSEIWTANINLKILSYR